ncbi:MAG TPA: hypothetical protein VH164_14275, partial [Ktedonobacteraceae bacterium]|nr:hypothetical protein [Ktedonobacteraceae bacterium]
SGETRQIHLYRLDPQMPLDLLQQRLRAILDLATDQLPECSAPVCLGRALDEDTINAGNQPLNGPTLLCPKPHVGPRAFDLVNVETDCLKNPLLCHVMDQAIIPPFVLPATRPSCKIGPRQPSSTLFMVEPSTNLLPF